MGGTGDVGQPQPTAPWSPRWLQHSGERRSLSHLLTLRLSPLPPLESADKARNKHGFNLAQGLVSHRHLLSSGASSVV